MIVRFAAGNGSVVASRTTRAHAHIGVQLGRCPTGVALVATRAVRTRRYMVDALAGCVASVVTTRAVRG